MSTRSASGTRRPIRAAVAYQLAEAMSAAEGRGLPGRDEARAPGEDADAPGQRLRGPAGQGGDAGRPVGETVGQLARHGDGVVGLLARPIRQGFQGAVQGADALPEGARHLDGGLDPAVANQCGLDVDPAEVPPDGFGNRHARMTGFDISEGAAGPAGFAVIPVLDLRGGRVVRARRGERSSYAPIETPLAKGSEPGAVAAGLLAAWPARLLYVADLDAIIDGAAPDAAALRSILSACPGIDLWVDAGFARAEQVEAFLAQGLGRPVIGTESQSDGALVAALGERAVLSLDTRGGERMGPDSLHDDPSFWPPDLITMTLAAVGAGTGPDLAALAAVRAKAPASGSTPRAGSAVPRTCGRWPKRVSPGRSSPPPCTTGPCAANTPRISLEPSGPVAPLLNGGIPETRPTFEETMEKFTTLEGVAAPMRTINVDTDRIIPAKYLKTIKRTGLGKSLFAEMRYREDGSENPDFILNRPATGRARSSLSATISAAVPRVSTPLGRWPISASAA